MSYSVKPLEVNLQAHHAVYCDKIPGVALIDFSSARKAEGFKKFLEKESPPDGDVEALIKFLKTNETKVKDCQWAKACGHARKVLEAL